MEKYPMRKIMFALVCLFIFSGAMAQKKAAYVIYNSKGKKVSYSKMLKTLAKQDIVMFGELHNNAIAHWLELEVTKDLGAKRNLVLGAEMYEADNQNALNSYLSSEYTYKQLDSAARLWNNNKTDYAPLVDYAKDNNLKFIATNIPRRYASKVHKGGFEALDTLSDLEKSWIAPLPMQFDSTMPTYVDILSMMGEHGSMNLVRAQATKDATMAHFLYTNYVPGSLFLHYNGSYHSNKKEGIVWYLKQVNSNLNIGNIAVVSQSDIYKLSDESKDLADFIICVDEDMTPTY
jgi:uncharacterized iron-regulated protein